MCPPGRGEIVTEEERGLEPHTPSDVHTVFETGPAPSQFFFRTSVRGRQRARTSHDSSPCASRSRRSSLPANLPSEELEARFTVSGQDAGAHGSGRHLNSRQHNTAARAPAHHPRRGGSAARRGGWWA